MAQEEITIVRVHKSTRNKLRRIAIAKRESYDEIINRLIGGEEEGEKDREKLQQIKQELLKKGISKDLVDLVGVIPKKMSLQEEKEAVGRAIRRKYGIG